MIDSTKTAIDTLNAISHLPDDASDIYIATRSLLIDPYDAEPMPDMTDPIAIALIPTIRAAIRFLCDSERDDPYYSRAALSDLMLNFSLCPMHRHDYAICFDDDDPDCATIRAYFPIHDT